MATANDEKQSMKRNVLASLLNDKPSTNYRQANQQYKQMYKSLFFFNFEFEKCRVEQSTDFTSLYESTRLNNIILQIESCLTVKPSVAERPTDQKMIPAAEGDGAGFLF